MGLTIRKDDSPLIGFWKSSYFPALDGLRAISVLLVIFFHTKCQRPSFIYGWLGVDIFFVLSGFVICTNYRNSVSTPRDLWNFFVARFARLYPLYLVFLCYDLLMKFGFNQLRIERPAPIRR